MCVLVHLNDILVYNINKAEHADHLRRKLLRLRGNKLFAKLSMPIRPNGSGVPRPCADPNRSRDEPTQGVCGKRLACSGIGKNMQQFLGVTSYYRRFLGQDYAEKALPLLKIKKVSPFSWDQSHRPHPNDWLTQIRQCSCYLQLMNLTKWIQMPLPSPLE
jgi:hypothetical protein